MGDLLLVQVVIVCIWVICQREFAEVDSVKSDLSVPFQVLHEELAQIYTEAYQEPLQLLGLLDGNGSVSLLFCLLSSLQIADTHDVVHILNLVFPFARPLQ